MNQSSRKLFDVAPPGQTPPPATSRPVIAKPPQPDPMFSQSPKPPASKPAPAPSPVEPPAEPAAPIDPQALLIQSGQWEPPKASAASKTRGYALIAMAVMLVLLCAVSYYLVSAV